MGLLASKRHTEGDIARWRLDYNRWLENTAQIVSATITSSSDTCTVDPDEITVLGREVVFLLSGGTRNERLTLSIVMQDSLGNTKNDTLAFTVVAP